MDRRKLLSISIQVTGLAAAGVVVVPALVSGLSPLAEPEATSFWHELGSVDEFTVGKVRKAVFAVSTVHDTAAPSEKSVYVWRRGAEEFVVFSRACTDLGCPLHYDEGSEAFYCPCHGGIFSKDGERMAGPPNRPLWRYTNRIRNGRLEIDLLSVPLMV